MAENPIGEQKNQGLSDAEIKMAKKIHNEKKIREQVWGEFNKAEDMLNKYKKKLAKTTNSRQSKDLERKIKQLERALLTKSNLPTPLAECNYYDEDKCNNDVLCYWNDYNRNCNARIPFVWAKRGLIPGERIKEGDRWLVTIPREENLSDEERRVYGEWRMRTRKEKRDSRKNEENERLEQENKSPENDDNELVGKTTALQEETALPVDLNHPQFSKEANIGDPKEKDPTKNKLEIGGGKRKTKRKFKKRKTMKNKRLKRKKTRKKRKSRKRRKTKKRSKRR